MSIIRLGSLDKEDNVKFFNLIPGKLVIMIIVKRKIFILS